MTFSVSFIAADESVAAATASPSERSGSDDGYEILVMEACSVLSDAGGSKFHIGGFGDDEWPLDVAYDLSAFMEQFPLLLGSVRERCEVEVDIYSQGIERSLTFRPSGESVMIHCHSRTSWIPSPEVEVVDRRGLISMLEKLAENFARSLRVVNLELSGAEPFKHWLDGDI